MHHPLSRSLIIHCYESFWQRDRGLANTEKFAKARRQRKKVEALFAELKNLIGLRRLFLDRLQFAPAIPCCGGCSEHQATRALPQPADQAYSFSSGKQENSQEIESGTSRRACEDKFFRTCKQVTRLIASYKECSYHREHSVSVDPANSRSGPTLSSKWEATELIG